MKEIKEKRLGRKGKEDKRKKRERNRNKEIEGKKKGKK